MNSKKTLYCVIAVLGSFSGSMAYQLYKAKSELASRPAAARMIYADDMSGSMATASVDGRQARPWGVK